MPEYVSILTFTMVATHVALTALYAVSWQTYLSSLDIFALGASRDLFVPKKLGFLVYAINFFGVILDLSVAIPIEPRYALVKWTALTVGVQVTIVVIWSVLCVAVTLSLSYGALSRTGRYQTTPSAMLDRLSKRGVWSKLDPSTAAELIDFAISNAGARWQTLSASIHSIDETMYASNLNAWMAQNSVVETQNAAMAMDLIRHVRILPGPRSQASLGAITDFCLRRAGSSWTQIGEDQAVSVEWLLCVADLLDALNSDDRLLLMMSRRIWAQLEDIEAMPRRGWNDVLTAFAGVLVTKFAQVEAEAAIGDTINGCELARRDEDHEEQMFARSRILLAGIGSALESGADPAVIDHLKTAMRAAVDDLSTLRLRELMKSRSRSMLENGAG